MGITQQVGSNCKENLVGFNEGSLIPRIIGKKTTKDMYDALESLYQSVNVSRKMILRNNLTTTHLRKIDTIGIYLMKILTSK